MRTLSIHNETEADLEPIRQVNRSAFGRDAEAELVDRLRSGDDILASLVALEGGEIIGHICFSRVAIERDGATVAAAALAPVAVVPEHQGKGVGSMLILRGLDSCRGAKVAAILVVGDPGYYERFGFSAEQAAKLDAPYSGESFLALELEPGVLDKGGVTRYAIAFEGLT